MDILNIIILSIIQGITEFLPISSSSHLILLPMFTKFPDQGIMFDVALHTGSLFAILIYYKNEIKNIFQFTDNGKSYIRLIIIGSIPLPIAGLLLIDLISLNLRSIEVISVMTITFALLLLYADNNNKSSKQVTNISTKIILIIGLFQILALVPGVSRSGIVITAALLLNYNRNDAIKIAFLLSIPAIFMASSYNLLRLSSMGSVSILNDHLLGMTLSLIVSYLTIYFFIATINKVSFAPYIIYRMMLGTLLLII
jgi:undecaprenyl-diphosphatase